MNCANGTERYHQRGELSPRVESRRIPRTVLGDRRPTARPAVELLDAPSPAAGPLPTILGRHHSLALSSDGVGGEGLGTTHSTLTRTA